MNRKELKNQYKQTLPPMGIFQIRNKVNGKIFIGKSKNLNSTYNRNTFELKAGSHRSESLQKDWKVFGEENFVYEIVDRLEPKDDPAYKYDEDLFTLKQLWFEKLQPYNEKGYNSPKDLNPLSFY